MTATLAGTVTGSNITTLNKQGLGILALTGAANNFGGVLQVNINGGTLTIAADGTSAGSLGFSPSVFTPAAILIGNGASFGANNATATITPNRGITIAAGGGYFANHQHDQRSYDQ